MRAPPLPLPVSAPTARILARVLLAMLRVAMMLVLVGAGGAKLVGVAWMVALFEAMGMGQWLRYVIGVLEILGGLALLVPSLAGVAALGLVGLMLGAVMTELIIVRRPPLAASASLAALMLIAWGHRRDTRRLLARALALRTAGRR